MDDNQDLSTREANRRDMDGGVTESFHVGMQNVNPNPKPDPDLESDPDLDPDLDLDSDPVPISDPVQTLPTGFELKLEYVCSIFSIIFIVWDPYSDDLVAYQLFTGNYDPEEGFTAVPQVNFGIVTILFPIISLLVTFYYWCRNETQKILSFPFLILQIYPVFSHIRLIRLLYKKDVRWRAEKDHHDQKVSLIEPFMEAMPQLVVQLCLWEAKLIPLNWIFWTTSLSSIMSTCWAFAKLLKVGPCQLLPKRKYGIGIVMVFLSVASAIAFKVYVLFSGIAFSNKPRWIQISVWVSLCLLPSLVLQIVCFLGSLGLKKTWSAISQFPGMILLPTITFWTYSGIAIKPSAEVLDNIARKSELKLTITNHHQIGVSMFFTWINFLMTLGGMLIYINFFAVQLTSSQCRFKDLTFNPGVVCETLQVSGQTIANGNYNLTSTQTWFDPKIPEEAITNSTKSIKVPIYKHTKQDLHIFYKPDGDGWRMGRKALIKNGSFIYKSNHDAVEPWLGRQKWDDVDYPKTINVKCTTLEKYSFKCQNKPCGNNGKCFGGKTTFYCDCPSGWTGITCTIPETCNKEAYEEIYLFCAILLGISMLLIMIIGCMLSCSCNCCCNFEIPGELGNNVSSVGKIKLLISRNCCPPILEKTYCDFTQRDENQADMNNSAEMVPFVHEQEHVQENIN